MLYVRNAREGPRGTPMIRRYNLTNEQDRALTLPGAGYRTPAWSRDGRYVAVTKTNSFGTDVVILDQRTGEELRRLTNDEQSFNPVWSPRWTRSRSSRSSTAWSTCGSCRSTGTAPDWTVGEPFAMTVSAGLDAASRPAWFIPADQLPPLPTPAPEPTALASEPGVTAAP